MTDDTALRLTRRRVEVAGRALVVSAVFLQRIAVPGINISISLVVMPLALGWLFWHGAAVIDEARARLYLLAVGAAAVAATVTAVVHAPSSLTSLLLLAALYAPLCLRVAPAGLAAYPRVLRWFTGAMSVVAVLAIGQMLAQLAGWHYTDLLGGLPHQLVLQGYHTAYPLQYGSSLMKSNGVVLLEPSFCSQFLAMAVVVQLTLGAGRARVALCLAGMLVTISGTGVILLAVGLGILALRRGGRWAVGAVVLAAVAVIALSASPLGGLYQARLGEVQQSDSSASLRFYAPYVRALDLTSSPDRLLLGNGPGFADRDATAYAEATGLPLNYPAAAKLLVEYGLPATVAFLLFIGTVLIRGAPSPTLCTAALVLYLALSGSLLQPPTVLLAALVTGCFAQAPRPQLSGGSISARPDRFIRVATTTGSR